MSGTSDELKGRAKQAAGDLADNDELKREGKADRAAGSLKDKLEDASDWTEDKVDDIKEKLQRD